MSTEEDQLVVSTEKGPPVLDYANYGVMILISVIILGAYLFINSAFHPAYPVINSYAENIDHYSEHYPPFRMNEWTVFAITESIVSGTFRQEDLNARSHPPGFPLIAAPLVAKFGEIGIYYANAFIMWLCSLVFLAVMIRIVPFALACVFTIVLAFATPNLFFATSAYPEPLGQLIMLLSLWGFVRGLASNRELIYYSLCGVITGLSLFVSPFMVFVVVVYAVVIFCERSDWSWNNKGVLSLLAGFAFSVVVFLVAYRIMFGGFLENDRGYFLYINSQAGLFPSTDHNGNVIAGIWKLLFDSPQGLVFIMPVVMLTPLGIISVWRKKMRSLALLTGLTVLLTILGAAAGFCSLSGETVGTRQLLPVIPFLVMPLALIWDNEAGERVMLAVLTVLTAYMCGFGFWAGTVRERGVFIGVLHDRNARGIILARKNLLPRPLFRSSGEIVDTFFLALENEDMFRWLQTLDRESLVDIQGFERVVFNDFVMNYLTGPRDEERFIASVNPDKGVRITIPEVIFKPE